jgi:hypothetical protein
MKRRRPKAMHRTQKDERSAGTERQKPSKKRRRPRATHGPRKRPQRRTKRKTETAQEMKKSRGITRPGRRRKQQRNLKMKPAPGNPKVNREAVTTVQKLPRDKKQDAGRQQPENDEHSAVSKGEKKGASRKTENSSRTKTKQHPHEDDNTTATPAGQHRIKCARKTAQDANDKKEKRPKTDKSARETEERRKQRLSSSPPPEESWATYAQASLKSCVGNPAAVSPSGRFSTNRPIAFPAAAGPGDYNLFNFRVSCD